MLFFSIYYIFTDYQSTMNLILILSVYFIGFDKKPDNPGYVVDLHFRRTYIRYIRRYIHVLGKRTS